MNAFKFGKIGVISNPTVSVKPAGRRLGDCPDHDCPAGFIRNAFGVCVIDQPKGTTYFVQTLAGRK